MHKNQGTGHTPDGEFTDGGPGVPRAVLGSAWLNMFQRELVAVVEGAGIALDPNNYTQLAAAIATMISQAVAPLAPLNSPELGGNPRAPTPAPGDNDTSIANTAFVVAALAAAIDLPRNLAGNGFYTLPGGLKLNWGSAVSNSDDLETFNFASAYTTAVFGVWLQERGGDKQERLWVNTQTLGVFTVDRDVGVDGTVPFFWVALGV